MKYTINTSGAMIIMAALSLFLGGCGGAKVLKEPVPQAVKQPLVSASDPRLIATLDWVIVRDGPGTWARNVDWDEYLIRVENRSDEPIRVTNVIVFDSLDTPIELGGNRKQLIKGSKETTRRYKDEGLTVKAGVGFETMAIAGGALTVTGFAVGMSALAGSSGALAASSAAVGAVVLGPILLLGGAVGGVVQGMNNREVNEQIEIRQTLLPAILLSSEKHTLDLFFPLAPSPGRIELTYVDTKGEHSLLIDTNSALNGLHLANGKE